MLKAIIKHSLLFLLLTTLLGLSGCSTPEEKREQRLEEARDLAVEGQNDAALALLEELAVDYPNDTEILHAMGRIYMAEQDHTMAAFFLEQAHQQNPQDSELLYQTYQAVDAAGQPSGEMLERLARLSPETMTDELWIRLGQFRAENNQIESALRAYLKGADLKARKPAPGTAAAIGRLFARVENAAQAERWFEAAADSDDPNAMTALFGLLEIQLRDKQWSAAEETIERLDKQFPGAVDASQWAQARQELKRWRAAQETMKTKLAAAEEARRKAAAEAANDRPVEVAEGSENESTATPDDSSAATEGKAQVIADMEAAEALADKPAIETDEPEFGPSVTFDPDIAVEPADPDFSFNVTYDEQALAPETNYERQPAPAEPIITPPETVEDFSPTPPLTASSSTSKSLEELLAEAAGAEAGRDFKSVIRKYWAAIGKVNNRPDIWNRLSRAYLIDGQSENAETAALEAIRLEPDEVAYTLDYLRIAQRTKTPDQFLSHLETAYDRFPASPEITLSMARAYERIRQDRPTARNLYQRFIDIAPNHPLVPEAREALTRLEQ